MARNRVLMAAVLCAALAACGGNNEDNNAANNTTPNNTSMNNMTTMGSNNMSTQNANMGNNCDSVPDACTTAGSSCEGDTSVVCSADANGCLVEVRTDCTTTALVCQGGACLAPMECMDDAECAGLTDGARFCTGDVLTTCADNGEGCLIASTNDCAAAGESCDMDTQMCVAACTDDAACAGMAAGDSFCSADGGTATMCADANGDGCLEATDTTCAAGEVCDATGGTAMCTGACPEAIQVLSCADAGMTIMGDTANGSSVHFGNTCPFGDSGFDSMEAIYVFSDAGNNDISIEYTFDDVNVGEFDAYAVVAEGTCSSATNTCAGNDYAFSSPGTLDFGAAGGQSYYLYFEPYNDAAATSPYGITITCTPAVCGDGALGGGEECDDGNTMDGDGCDMNCAEEANYICEGEPSVCTPDVCGDGTLSVNEQCDDANTMDGDGCDMNCDVEFGWSCDMGTCTQYPDLGTFAAAAAINDSTGGPLVSGDDDFYTITFSEDVMLTGSLTADTGDADLYFFAPNGEFVTGAASDGDEVDYMIALRAGQYLVNVNAWDQAADIGTYTLTMATTALAVPDIGTFAAGDAITAPTGGPITAGDRVFYTITLTTDATMTIAPGGNTTGLMGWMLYNENGAPARDPFSGDLLGPVPAGTYIVGILTSATDGDVDTYTLDITAI